MTEYLKVFNDDGSVQVADNTPMMFLQNKAKLGAYYVETTSVKYSGGWHTVYGYAVPKSSSAQAVFVSNPSSTIATLFCNCANPTREVNHSTMTILDMCHLFAVSDVSKSIADNFDVFIYSSDPHNNETFGLECFDENGRKIFNGTKSPLKVLNSFYEVNTGPKIWGDYRGFTAKSYNYPEKTLAFNAPINFYGGYEGKAGNLYAPLAYINNHIIRTAVYNGWEFGYSDWGTRYIMQTLHPFYRSFSTHMVVDVTNY